MDAGIPVIAGVVGTITLIVVVLGAAHCPAVGVNVNVILPLRPEGLKLFAVTPVPDQLPVMPLCVVGKAIAASVWHIEAGIPVIVGVEGGLPKDTGGAIHPAFMYVAGGMKLAPFALAIKALS